MKRWHCPEYAKHTHINSNKVPSNSSSSCYHNISNRKHSNKSKARRKLHLASPNKQPPIPARQDGNARETLMTAFSHTALPLGDDGVQYSAPPRSLTHSPTCRMERKSHPHQQQQPQWWPSPSPHDPLAAGDTDRHWDATVRLLALGDDDPVPLEHYGDKEPEEDGSENGGSAIFQLHSFRCEPLVGPVGDKRDADYRLSASLSEEDIAFIVSSTSEVGVAEEHSSDNTAPLEAAKTTTTIATATVAPRRTAARRSSAAAQGEVSGATTAALTIVTSPPAPAVMSSAEEARRERNRLKVRRLYYRKLVRVLLSTVLCDRFVIGAHSLAS